MGAVDESYLEPEAGELGWLSPRLGYQMEFCYFKITNYIILSTPNHGVIREIKRMD